MPDKEKKLFVCQSNYIPWKGYFDAINLADEFIIYDEMQYTKNDWRNRNKIKTAHGTQWITIPVRQHSLDQRINEMEVSDQTWRKKHWKSIYFNYQKALFYEKYEQDLKSLYLDDDERNLSQINEQFIKYFCNVLNINALISRSEKYHLEGDRSERLISLCKQTGASEYLSGFAAKAYLREDLFEKEDIRLSYLQYDNYPEYPQLFGDFDHHVSIIDLILNTGPEAPHYMKSFKRKGNE